MQQTSPMHGSWRVIWSQSPYRSLGKRSLDVCTRGLLPKLPATPVIIKKSTQYIDCARNRITDSLEIQCESALAAFTVHGSFVPMSTEFYSGFDTNACGLTWDVAYEVAYFTPLTHHDIWTDMYGKQCPIDGEVSLDNLSDRHRLVWGSRMHRLVRDADGLTLFGRRGSYLDIDASLAANILKYTSTGEW